MSEIRTNTLGRSAVSAMRPRINKERNDELDKTATRNKAGQTGYSSKY